MNPWSKRLHRGVKLEKEILALDPDALLIAGMELALVGYQQTEDAVVAIYDREIVFSQLLGMGFDLYEALDLMKNWVSLTGPYGGHGAPLAEQNGERCDW